ncbi:MAG: Crp/Fnr family transcriptional regulator [Aquincola tertiaricarbonis]
MLMPVIPLYRTDAVPHPQAQVCVACEVRQAALFGALDDAGLARIHEHIPSTEWAPDAVLWRRGERGSAAYTLRSGIVRFERITSSGERRIVRLAGRGDLIGQQALLGEAYADEAVACTPVRMCRLPAPMIQRMGAEEPALLQELMRRWQRAVDEAEGWLAELTTGPARRRLLRLLDRLAADAEPGALLWMPRRDEIGDMLNMTVETASRVVSQLRREGVLTLQGPRNATVEAAALRAALKAEEAG